MSAALLDKLLDVVVATDLDQPDEERLQGRFFFAADN
jgi:hypothetical protein